MPARILIIKEERALAEAMAFRLGSDGFLPEIRATGADPPLALRNVTFDLILLNIGLREIAELHHGRGDVTNHPEGDAIARLQLPPA